MDIKKIKEESIGKLIKNIEYYEEIGSTHTYAKEIAIDKQNDGKLILAEIQTLGIGTKGRSWYTGRGKNLAVTIILHPKCKINQLEGLTIEIANKIKESIENLYGYELNIKEPNDLMLNNKKICGILTEINTISEQINYLLISVGFNVNEEKFSPETENIATSLKKEFYKGFQREDIITRFIEILENNIIEEIEL